LAAPHSGMELHFIRYRAKKTGVSLATYRREETLVFFYGQQLEGRTTIKLHAQQESLKKN
jgi:hypothetical protein